jgi:hypothetical protein
MGMTITVCSIIPKVAVICLRLKSHFSNFHFELVIVRRRSPDRGGGGSVGRPSPITEMRPSEQRENTDHWDERMIDPLIQAIRVLKGSPGPTPAAGYPGVAALFAYAGDRGRENVRR